MKIRFIVILFIFSIIISNDLLAISPEAKTLKGIELISISLGLSDDAKNMRLIEATIKTDIELKLRQAKLKLTDLNLFNYADSQNYCWLQYSINIICPKDDEYCGGVCVGSIILSAYQYAHIYRFGEEPIFAIVKTWGNQFYGHYVKDGLNKEIRNTIKDLTDSFINEYLAANPISEPKQTLKEKYGTSLDTANTKTAKERISEILKNQKIEDDDNNKH